MKRDLFKWGIIGPGRIAHRFAKAFAVIDDVVVHAVASRDRKRADEFAGTYQASRVYDSYANLAEDPEVDAIYIATPHRFHFENTMTCLDAGKPVLCEKPLTVNALEAKKLIDTSRDKKVFLMEALWTRYLPVYQEIRRWLDDGLIGEVKLLTSTFSFRVPRNLEDRLLNHELAGGALLDIGVYNIAISQWAYQRNPQSFTAWSFLGKTNVDEMTTVHLHYENDAVSQFTAGLLVNGVNDFFIYGADGYIRIHPMFWDATRATLATSEREVTLTKPYRATGFEYQVEEATKCIREGSLESPRMTHADTLANMSLMDQIRERVGLKYTFEPTEVA